jgi:ABC-2 type transport system permease protein
MTITKYTTIFRIASRDQLIYLPSFLARNIFFIIVIYIFYALWGAVYSGKDALVGFTMVQTLWYLTFTEAIELSQSRIFIQISEEVKDGTIAYQLGRPYSYIAYWVSKAMGENLVKLVPMLVEGFILASLLIGVLPGYLSALPIGLIVLTGGILIGTLMQVCIGLLAFWFEEVMPFWWIIQKLVFVIGGMFIPIDFYPDWLQGIAKMTPFAFASYWPASTIVAFSWSRAVTTLVGQAICIAVLAGVAMAIFRAAVRKLHVQGG